MYTVPVIQSTAISLGNSLRHLQSSNILSRREGLRTQLMRVTISLAWEVGSSVSVAIR